MPERLLRLRVWKNVAREGPNKLASGGITDKDPIICKEREDEFSIPDGLGCIIRQCPYLDEMAEEVTKKAQGDNNPMQEEPIDKGGRYYYSFGGEVECRQEGKRKKGKRRLRGTIRGINGGRTAGEIKVDCPRAKGEKEHKIREKRRNRGKGIKRRRK